jgi:hypothetical protein
LISSSFKLSMLDADQLINILTYQARSPYNLRQIKIVYKLRI